MSKYKPNNTLSVYQFMQMFPDEASALNHLEELRWGNSPICPHCKKEDRSSTISKKANVFRCKDCLKEYSVRHGSIFARSHIPQHKWLYASYLMVTSRKGISSLQLSKEIGITQANAWFMLQRLREACQSGDELLSGVVEVDETYIGGKEANKRADKKLKIGRGAVGKQAVMGLRERGGKVKAMPIQRPNKLTLQNKITEQVKKGSTVYTDDHRGYLGLSKRSYKHQSVNHSAKEYVNGMAHTNGIESVWAVLKRGYNGVYHNMSAKHLHRYVNEFTFRLNEGNCGIDTMDRINSMLLAGMGKRITYKELINE